MHLGHSSPRRHARRAVLVRSALLPAGCDASTPKGDDHAAQARVARLLRAAPLMDGHIDLMIHHYACGKGCPRGLDD